MTGHFDVLTDMFITRCVPVLSDSIKRDELATLDETRFSTVHKYNLVFCDIDVNCVNTLGYEKEELVNKKSLYDLLDVKSLEGIRNCHKQSKMNKNILSIDKFYPIKINH